MATAAGQCLRLEWSTVPGVAKTILRAMPTAGMVNGLSGSTGGGEIIGAACTGRWHRRVGRTGRTSATVAAGQRDAVAAPAGSGQRLEWSTGRLGRVSRVSRVNGWQGQHQQGQANGWHGQHAAGSAYQLAGSAPASPAAASPAGHIASFRIILYTRTGYQGQQGTTGATGSHQYSHNGSVPAGQFTPQPGSHQTGSYRESLFASDRRVVNREPNLLTGETCLVMPSKPTR